MDLTVKAMVQREVAGLFRTFAASMQAAADVNAALSEPDKPSRTPKPAPARKRKPRQAKPTVALVDAAGKVYSGRGRKPTGFDASTAKPQTEHVNGAADGGQHAAA